VTGSCEVKFGADLSGWTGKLLVDGADAQSLKTNGVSMPAIEINKGGGTCTAQDAVTVHDADGFLLAAGTYDDGGNAHNIAGDIISTGGTRTSTAKWTMTADGNLSIGLRVISEFANDVGVTTTITGYSRVKKLSIAGMLSGTQIIEVNDGPANWLAGSTGTLSCPMMIRITSNSPGADITLGDKDLRIFSTSTHTIALAGVDLGTGDLWIYGDGAGDSMTVTLSGPLTCRDIILGDSNSNGLGALTLGNTATIRSVAEGGGGGANTINLASCAITQTGTFDGTNITPTNTAAQFIGGTIANLDASGTATINALSGVTDGGGNVNVNFFDGHHYLFEFDEAYRSFEAYKAFNAYSLRR